MRETRLPHARLAIPGLIATMIVATPAWSADTSLAPLPDAKEIKADRAELGRMLFFDARLSGPGTVQLASASYGREPELRLACEPAPGRAARAATGIGTSSVRPATTRSGSRSAHPMASTDPKGATGGVARCSSSVFFT